MTTLSGFEQVLVNNESMRGKLNALVGNIYLYTENLGFCPSHHKRYWKRMHYSAAQFIHTRKRLSLITKRLKL